MRKIISVSYTHLDVYKRQDEYREEYNKILLEKATGANAIVQDKYMTISVNKKNIVLKVQPI